ncbi:MAG TPA: hypothetical protein VFZ59_16765 [Verrucomicrobiae bacterium]|nr:hypothetical protein [Verrucomicrobiae bacterium]
MKTLLAFSMVIATTASTLACGDYASFRHLLDCSGQVRLSRDDLTRDAISADKTKSEDAIRMLRARGPEGLRALLDANAAVLKERSAKTSPFTRQPPDESWQRIKAALDGVSGQRDGYASQLYWYTDFEQARAAARAQAKPILSLRLLGKLDEEFSCANSRFFRTTLYANAEVSQYLRDHFILHWKSVRPVPRVTIDFGDGRVLERTITGNSIHYVLAADGSVIDALPGLYGPKAFLRGLNRAEEIAQQIAAANVQQRMALLTQYHRDRIAVLNSELQSDLQRLPASASLNSSSTVFQLASLNPATPPATAQEAARLTNTKRAAEARILDAPTRSQPQENGSNEIDDATWSKLAALHQKDSRLDESSLKLIRSKNPTAFDAGRAAITKTFVEDPLLRQIRNLQRSISEDTVRNEYSLHPKIHAWLASGETTNVDALNRRVYAELFLTPDSDPWLGLVSPDTFTALENNGVAQVGGDNSKTPTATAPGL